VRAYVLVGLIATAACQTGASYSSATRFARTQRGATHDVRVARDVDLRAWAAPEGAGGAAIGGNAPIETVLVDPRQRWVLACTTDPESGTVVVRPPQWRFVLGSGPGYALGAVYAVDASGDRLVVKSGASTLLVDIPSLHARALEGAEPPAGFSQDGRRLVYRSGSNLVRLDLASNISARVKLPAGEAGDLQVDTTGRWAMVAMARVDADKNGTVSFGDYQWPRPFRCGHVTSLADMANDPIERIWVDLQNDAFRDDPAILRMVGDRALTRDGHQLRLDGTLYGPRDCTEGINVVCMVESPLATLLDCGRSRRPSTLALVGPAPMVIPGQAFLAAPRDAPIARTGEFCPGGAAPCVELATGRKRKDDTPLPAIGVHDGLQWYAGTPTHLLVGHPDHGPVHWQPR